MKRQQDLRHEVIVAVQVRDGHVQRPCKLDSDPVVRPVNADFIAVDPGTGDAFIQPSCDTQLTLTHTGGVTGFPEPSDPDCRLP